MAVHLSKLFYGIQYIWFGISIYIIMLLILSQTTLFWKTLDIEKFSFRDYVQYTALFTILGAFGTFWNFSTPGGIMTFRAVAVILAGFIGGPIVGTLTGLNVGLIRGMLLQTGVAGISGALTILLGIAAGQVSLYLKKKSPSIAYWTLICTLALEIGYWFLYALLTWPTILITPINFWGLAIPVILTNIPPVVFSIWLLQTFVQRIQTRQAHVTYSAFRSVNMLLQTLSPSDKVFDAAVIPQIITHMVPGIIWAAVIQNDTLYNDTNYKVSAHETQGNTELSILMLEHSLPNLNHIAHVFAKYKNQPIMEIYVAVPNTTSISSDILEFVKGLKTLIELMYDREMLKNEEFLLQEAEIKMLQAQINPHFLYNTLNTISFYTRTDPDNARKLIGYLSDYFRYSLTNPTTLIPLKNELHDIKCYMELQQARFGDLLKIKCQIPEEIAANLKVPPLLLQPLVENAVIHGLRGKEDGGTILLGVHEHVTFYRIYVIDNGVGIYHHKLRSILAPNRKQHNLGLLNVKQRMKSIFGPKGRMRILSRKGRGTIVYLDIPKEMYNESLEHTNS